MQWIKEVELVDSVDELRSSSRQSTCKEIGHLLVPVSEKKWHSSKNSPQGAWDHIADEMLLEFAESGHPTFRATTPLTRGVLKSKGHGKLSIHFTADYPTIVKQFFAS